MRGGGLGLGELRGRIYGTAKMSVCGDRGRFIVPEEEIVFTDWGSSRLYMSVKL